VIYIRPVEERGWPQTVEFVITITVGSLALKDKAMAAIERWREGRAKREAPPGKAVLYGPDGEPINDEDVAES
jgi:hypothetical protein